MFRVIINKVNNSIKISPNFVIEPVAVFQSELILVNLNFLPHFLQHGHLQTVLCCSHLLLSINCLISIWVVELSVVHIIKIAIQNAYFVFLYHSFLENSVLCWPFILKPVVIVGFLSKLVRNRDYLHVCLPPISIEVPYLHSNYFSSVILYFLGLELAEQFAHYKRCFVLYQVRLNPFFLIVACVIH